MIKLQLADYLETQKLAAQVGVTPKLKTLAYRVSEGDSEKGFCVFSLQEQLCLLEAVSLEGEDTALADGLIRACLAHCMDSGATHFAFSRQRDETQYIAVLYRGEGAKKPYEIAPVLTHCHG